MHWSKNPCSVRKPMLQGRVGCGKDGEHRHKDRAGWKSHDQSTGCFPSVEMLFAGVVWSEYVLILVRFSYLSSSKRRLKPELARLFCVAFSSWEARKCAEHVAVDQRGLLRITWSMCVHRSIESELSNTESEGSNSRSPGSSTWACCNPCCNTISVLKVTAAAQVHGVPATVHLICWYIEPAPCLWASEPLGLASTKSALKRSNWERIGRVLYPSPLKWQMRIWFSL